MAAKTPVTTGKDGQAQQSKATAARKKPATPRATIKPKTPQLAAPAEPVVPAAPLSPEDELIAVMDPRHVEFVEHYLVDHNATKAYLAAFNPELAENVARSAASRLLTTVNVKKLLCVRVKALFERTEDLQDRMLAQQFAIAFADPNELVEHRREACRYCYGEGHRYQRKTSEQDKRKQDWAKAVDEAIEEGEPPPEWDEEGGIGYDPRKRPHEDCPECFGDGDPRIVMKDTRDLSPGARALYAGAEYTKEGPKINPHSQEKARDVLLKILKLFDDKAEIIVGVIPQEKLDDMYARAMANAEAGRARTQGRSRLPSATNGEIAS